MRQIILISLLAIVVGCASTPHVALPAKTDFDDNPKARKAYLEAYREGYLAQMAGHSGVICLFGRDGIVGTAREIGRMMGQFAASEAMHEKRIQEIEAEAAKHK